MEHIASQKNAIQLWCGDVKEGKVLDYVYRGVVMKRYAGEFFQKLLAKLLPVRTLFVG